MRLSRVLTLLAPFAGTAPAAAQSLWLVPEHRRALLLEVFHVDLDGPVTEFPSAALYLTGRVRLNDRFALQVEVPAAYIKIVPGIDEPSEADLGNPYLGLVITATNPRLWGEVGLRLPFGANTSARVVGAYADLARFEAWFDDAVPLVGLVGYQWSHASGLFGRVRGGPSIWVATRGATETEAVLHADLLGGWRSGKAVLATALSSLTTLTSEAGFARRTVFQVGFLAEAHLGSVRPGVTLFVPIDRDLREAVTVVVGGRVGVGLE
jgi:hypothetical protein